MNTDYREQLHRTVNDDLAEYFNSLLNRITSNGESSDVKFLSFDSSEPPCPLGPGQFTKLKLTDAACSITSFNESFIKLRIKSQLNLTLTKVNTEIDNTQIEDGYDQFKRIIGDYPALYVGFKSGIHAIDHYRFYNEKAPAYMCEQSQAVYESALTYFTKSKEEIEGTYGTYATAESIKNYEKGVPGQYITWSQVFETLNTTKQIPLDFEVVIRYDDFAPLQFFDLYPNGITGNMQMEFKINNIKNMVIAYIPPYTAFSETIKKDLNNSAFTLNQQLADFSNIIKEYDHIVFYNIGSKCRLGFPYKKTEGARGGVDLYNLCNFDITATTSSLYLLSARSYINGYNIKQDKINEISSILSTNKIYIPAQRIDQYSFSQTPTNTNMSCNTTQTLINCSSMIFTFPRDQYELTCSFNPCCDSIQLMIDNKTLPDKPFSTYDSQYINYTLSGLMFNDFFKPNTTLMNSLTTPKIDISDTNKGVFISDCSNYLLNFPLERLDSSPYVFDGITKDNCFITLNGTYTKPLDNDTSIYFKMDSRQPPIMYLCQDTLWEMSTDGLKYYYNDKNIIPSITN